MNRERMKIWLKFLAPSLLIGFAVGAVPGYYAYRYTWYDADFCYSCHVHDYANLAWKNSSHGQSTTCHDCHHQPLRAYLRETWLMLTKRPKFPQDLHHTPYVPNDLCQICHVSGADPARMTGPMPPEEVEKIPKVDAQRLHQIHLNAETDLVLENKVAISESERSMTPVPDERINRDRGEKRRIACADCHGGTVNRGHNFSAIDRSCVRCHEPVHQNGLTKTVGCRSCHFQSFLVPSPHADIPPFGRDSIDKTKEK